MCGPWVAESRYFSNKMTYVCYISIPSTKWQILGLNTYYPGASPSSTCKMTLGGYPICWNLLLVSEFKVDITVVDDKNFPVIEGIETFQAPVS